MHNDPTSMSSGGDLAIEVETIEDISVAIDTKIVSDVIRAAMRRKQYEHVEARVGRALFETDEIQQGQRILEIGAGLGYVGSVLSSTGKVEQILSYEANPNLIPLIEETHRLNGVKSEVRNALLGDQNEGYGTLVVPEHFWAASTTGAKGQEHQVKYASLSETIAEFAPSFLLIDIEGGEEHLFDSLTEMPSVHSILIELHQRMIGRAGIQKVFEQLHRLGFAYDQRYSISKVVLFQKTDFPMKA